MNGNVFDRFVADDAGLHLELLVQPAINYALVHNRVPLVRRLELRNTGTVAMPAATVTLELLGPTGRLVPPWQRDVPPRMAAGHTLAFDEFSDVVPERSLLLSTDEAYPVDYRVSVTLADQTEPALQLTAPSRVLAHNEWFHSPALYDSLAAFVQPNTSSVGAILREATQILVQQTGSGALQGYQAGGERAAEIGGAIYEALRRHGINYQALPASFERTGQKVRTTSAVLSAHLGNCLDLSVTYAACLEAAGLHPLIWLTRSHAFAGFLMSPQRLSTAAVTSSNRIVAMIESGMAIPVELTAIGRGDQSLDFAGAVDAALNRVRSRIEDLEGVVDVHLAHRTGIQPLPSTDTAMSAPTPLLPLPALAPPVPNTDAPVIGSISLPAALAKVALAQLDGDTEPTEDPTDSSPPRVRQWKKALLDLSLRNPLLNLPARGRSLALHLPPGALALLDDLIHDGKKLEIVPQDQISGVQELAGVQGADELDPEQLLKELKTDRRVYGAVAEAKYVATMRTLQRDARTMQQETGSNYLYLTLGTLVHAKATGEEAHAPLFLLPVRIEGGTGRKPYHIVADGAEIAEPNYCLIEWLRVKHSMQIPELNSPIRDERGIDIPATVAAINARLVDSRLDYRVDEIASLRLLQFSTFQMWRDLTDNWLQFLQNPVVKHLVEATGETFRDPVGGAEEPEIDEADLLLPIPADGSQMEAIVLAEQGRSFVLEGPPGTGKSQTITNLIARAVSTGRSVLFVAEKQAALDVVKRRLKQVGLGPFVLDLHGRKQSVRAIKEQLRTALDQREHPDDPTFTAARAGFRARLTPLADYPNRVHESNAAGSSLWTGYAGTLAYGDGPTATIPGPFLASDKTARAAVDVALREIPTAARSARLRAEHPWAISGRRRIDDLDLATLVRLAGALEQSRLAVQGEPALAELLVHVPSPEGLADLLAVAQLAARGALPERETVDRASDPRWDPEISRLIGEITKLRQDCQAELANYRGDVFTTAPVGQWLAEAREANDKWFGKGKARRLVAAQLSEYLSVPLALDSDQIEMTLQRLVAGRGRAESLRAEVVGLGGLPLPDAWSPTAPNGLTDLEAAHRATVACRTLRSGNPAAWAALSAGVTMSLVVKLERLTEDWSQWRTALHSGGPELTLWAGDAPWWEIWHRDGTIWLAELNSDGLFPIQRWAALLGHADRLAAAGLPEFRSQLLRTEIDADEAETAYRRGVARASVRERLTAGALDFFDPAVHNNHIAQFRASGESLREELPEHLPSMVVRRRPFGPNERRGRPVELAAELRRQRGGRTFRELFTAYSDVILALTPCVLVSPASAAQFLAPDAARFDLVVFDEASQIRVAEAVGAMGRGRASVIVGDSRQMPPTTIMQASHVTDEPLPTEDDIVVPEDLDSILSEAVESGLPQRWLSWHYRSRDEALIAFSNRYYYDGRLSTLPSPGHAETPAISWRRLEGTFERAAARTNKLEADAIVAEIAKRLAEPATADDSIGVVTFNIQQRDLILNLLEESNDPLIKAALPADSDEPIFVKNLENVQGDERDLILFSLAFSPNPQTGQLPLNFGPLNLQGGERRLNVAITRARKQIILFASFDPYHIDLTRTNALGLHHLRAYCDLAASHTQFALESSGGRRDLIREEIAAAIAERGYEVQTGIGLSDFTVDIAVRRRGRPRWQLAVMLDGPAWANRRTVSDRDLTPLLLTGSMGWPALFRCWLPAWLHKRSEVLDQIVAAIPPFVDEPTARFAAVSTDEVPTVLLPTVRPPATQEQPVPEAEPGDEAQPGGTEQVADTSQLATVEPTTEDPSTDTDAANENEPVR